MTTLLATPSVRTGGNAAVRWCAWGGPAFVLLFLLGAVPFTRFFWPPTSADQSAEAIVAMYTDHLVAIRIGILLMCLATPLWVPFSLAIAEVTRPTDPQHRILYHLQVAFTGVATIVILLIPILWCVAAYRPGDIAPEITQSWNDSAWFGVLFAWPPFSLWCLVIAASIMVDREARLPRWVAYLNIWAAALFAPAACMLFTKTGPMAQNGAICFWVPIVVFFGWIVAMSWVVIRSASGERS